MFDITIALLCHPAEMPCIQQGCRMSWMEWLVTMEQSPKHLDSLWIIRGNCRTQEWWQWSFLSSTVVSTMLFLLQTDPTGGSGFRGKKCTKRLRLDYLAQCQLNLWAGMREMGRKVHLLSSRAREAGQRKPAGCTLLFLSVYSKEKWRRSLKHGQLHRFLRQNQAQQWY